MMTRQAFAMAGGSMLFIGTSILSLAVRGVTSML